MNVISSDTSPSVTDVNKNAENDNVAQISRRGSFLNSSDREVNDDITPLLNAKNSILQHIPESLPTTPGYEIPRLMFTDPPPKDASIPTQRPSLYRKESKPSWSELTDVLKNLVSSKKEEEEEALAANSVIEGGDSVNKSNGIGDMTFHNPPKNLWRVCACCGWCFSAGLSDGAPGALLPYIERYYKITYSVVSLIWMAGAIGYILVACFSHKIEPVLKKQMSLVIGCFCFVIMFALVLTGSKFPVIVLGFFFGGLGAAIAISQMNIFLSRLEKASTALGYYHGCYGIGATLSPLIATQFVNHNFAWHYYYLIVLGAMIINCINLFASFSGADKDLAPWDGKEDLPQEDITHGNITGNEIETSIGLSDLNNQSRDLAEESLMKEEKKRLDKELFKLALQNKTVWTLGLFLFFYQGSEVAMGGWIVTFLLEYRNGNPKYVGYVASGYWGGLTVGRLCLTRGFHKVVGARRAIIILAIISIICIILAWAVPNVIVSGVFVSISGIFIGPTYPLLITIAARVLPRKIQTISLTVVTAVGTSGSAIFPFVVGLISQFKGPYVVHPVFITLYLLMTVAAICLPNFEREGKQSNLWQRIW